MQPTPAPEEVPRPDTSGSAILIVSLLVMVLLLGGGMGLLSWFGDKDGDSIANHDDACPDAAGEADLQGCPPPPPPKEAVSESACADMSAGEIETFAEEIRSDVNDVISGEAPWRRENIAHARELLQALEGCPEDLLPRQLTKTRAELEVVGKPMPELGAEDWFQGGPSDLSGGTLTLLLFWEAWCPHCKREAPHLQEAYAQYRERGLRVVGATKVTRSSTDQQVQSFLTDKGIAYPVFREDGALSTYFNVTGIPAAALIKDGEIIWRGHPARLKWDAVAKDLL